ncbi:MAG: hypothetical protein KDE51_18105 [Anaerolineales bacterium]|nr:hypothetical protein [Anaerolineales bacterium]
MTSTTNPPSSYRIWRNIAGLVVFAAPFATWQRDAFDGSRSFVSFVYQCWLMLWEQFSTAALVHNIVVTICLLILLAAGLFLSLGFVRQEIRVTTLVLCLLFAGTIFVSGTAHLGWGYWLGGAAVLVSLVLEVVEMVKLPRPRIAPPTRIDRRQVVI